ncbi:phage regulatory CII family protein [Shewanella sp. T24-MNA-CIBAN-0130]|jgi:hypothetical protein|uniref:phage regulatory CII family protein n=1 Tax=Shewanella sp. T24-MNA-CIBAN-0130 TaxID=3140470 RepID=UPI00331F425E
MFFSKKDTRKGNDFSQDPLLAAASLIDVHNISDLARQLGKNPKTLLAKLNNDSDFHQLNLGEAIAITNMTGDNRILGAWAKSLNCILVNEPDPDGVTDEDFSDLLLSFQSQLGDLSRTILKAREDGVITTDEYADIHATAIRSVQLVFQIDTALRSQIRG